MIKLAQLRAARALLHWNVERLAREANVSSATVRRYEAGENLIPIAVQAIESALDRNGIEFIDRGVRLREMSEAA